MCKFFCGLGTVFGLNASDMSKSSIFFAGATKILFNGKGFSVDDVTKYGGTVLKRPFTDCNKLCRWHIVKEFNLKQESCIICPMSSNYKNARIESESLLLRQSIYTGNLTEHESDKFHSVVSIKPGNDISDYPIIPFLAILNQFFMDNHPSGPYHDKESLVSLFGEYLCKKLGYSESSDRKAVLNCVKRELNVLYDFDFSALEGLANTAYINLLSEYSYKAPKIMFPSSLDDSPTIVPVKKTTSKKKNHSPKQGLLYSESYSTKNNKVKGNKNITDSSKSDGSKNTNQNKNNDGKKKVEKDNPSSVKVKPQNSNADPTNQSLQETNSTKHIDNVYYVNAKCDNNSTDSTKLENIISYPKYSISKEFTNKITHCTTGDPKSVLNFITDICSSQYVSVESVVLYKRHGLLFFTSYGKKFYFYDLEYAPSGHLYTAMSDASKIKFLSLNPLPVISMFSKIGFHSVQVESLCGLYWLYNSKDKVQVYNDIFMNVLSINNDSMDDFYSFYMPHYENLYNKIIYIMNNNNKITDLEEYKEGVKLESALGTNYDLSDLLYGLTNSISGQGFFDYEFNYRNDIPYIKRGVLYTVNLTNMDMDVDEYSSNNFFEKIAIQVHNSSSQYVRHAKLITFVDKGIVYYSTMNGDLFFDVLLDIIRRNYNKIYGTTPVLKTYRVEYK